jgi:hypothetical protein
MPASPDRARAIVLSALAKFLTWAPRVIFGVENARDATSRTDFENKTKRGLAAMQYTEPTCLAGWIILMNLPYLRSI